MKKYLLSLILLLCSNLVFAQKYFITGKVCNASTKAAVEFATAGLLRADSTLLSGATTNEKGEFKINAKSAGKYILRISYIGYNTHFIPVTLTRQAPSAKVDTIALESYENLLSEAVVKATLSKVEQKEDTTVFNAGAYRVPEGSTLQALVKQLPGVEVKDDGSVTWNGKTITEFLVNGKDFFKGDKDVAMKNLPTDLVSKIKAYEKKSDYTEKTGIDDGEEKTVLDISTKKKLDESWISNINLGYGTKDRYSADIFISRWTERSRVSAYASLGNVDKYSGYGGGGLTSNKSGGLDMSWENGKDKKEAGKFEVGGSIYYGYNGSDMLSTSSSETFLSSGSTSSFSNSFNRNSNSSSHIGSNLFLEWNPDTMTSIRFRPSFSHSKGDNDGDSRTVTFNSDPFAIDGVVNPLDEIFADSVNEDLSDIAVNRNSHNSLGESESNSLNGELSVLRRLNSKGRNLSFRARGAFSESKSKSFSNSDIFYFQDGKSNFLNQYSNTPSKNWNYNLRFGYAEPITDKLVAEIRYSYAYKYNDSDRSRYNLDRIGGMWADPDNYPLIGTLPTAADSLAAVRDLQNSQYATYEYFDHNVDLSMQYKSEKMRLNIGAELNPERTEMEYNRPGQHIDTLITRKVFQVSPDARFRYRFSDSRSLEVRYRGSASQPSMTSLLAVVDNSNPLSVSMGNPGLKPSWSNSLSVSYNGYDWKKQQGVHGGANYSQTNRTVSNLLVYDETTGVRYTRPENIDGNWNASSFVVFNTGIGKEKNFTMMSYTNMSYNNAVGYVSSFASKQQKGSVATELDEHSVDYYDEIFKNADIKKNTTRDLGLSQRLRFSYRKDWFEGGLNAGMYYNHSHSTLQNKSNMNVWNYDYGAHANFTFDFGLSFSSDIHMKSRRGYSDATMNTNELLWNAQMSYSFLEKKAATISMDFYDILHEKRNVRRSVTAMHRSDSWTNAIHSYCMIHFVYKLNIFPGSKGAGDKGGKSGVSDKKGKGGYKKSYGGHSSKMSSVRFSH